MKKIKLLLAAMAAMVTVGVNAQDWTGNAPTEGTFFLYNVGAAKFLNNGDPNQRWGTNAYLQEGFGMDLILEAASGDNVFNLNTNVSNGGNSHYLANSTWCDGGATPWTFSAVDGETNVYQIINDGKYLMATEGLDDVEMLSDPGSRVTSTYWKLVSLDDFKAAMRAKTYSSTDPMDVSVFIKGRSFARNDGRNSSWNASHNGGNWTWIGSWNGGNGDPLYFGNESWNNTFNVYQNITGLIEGTYEVRCSGFGTNGTTFIYGNNTSKAIQSDNSTAYGTNVNAKWKAIHEDNAFAGQTTGTFTVGDGNLTVGIKRETNQSYDWAVWDEFRLYYYGLDLSEFATSLAAAVSAAEAVEGTIPTAAYTVLAAVVTENNKSYTSVAEYTAATNAIIEATTTAKALQARYTQFATVKANVLALKSQTDVYTDEGGVAATALDNAVTSAQTAVDAATDEAGILLAVQDLHSAAATFAGSVAITKGKYLDLTDALLSNASMRNSGDLDLWTIANNSNSSYPKYANNCSEFWQANFDFYQETILPEGNFNIEVSAFHRAAQEGSTYHTYLYADPANSEIKSTLVLPLSNGEDNTGQAENSFNQGLYINSIKLALDASDMVKIGFKNEDTADDLRENGNPTDKWTIFRDFKIKFFGSDALSVYRDEYEEALAAAAEALEDATYANIAGTDRSNLSTAVTTTYPKSVVETDEKQEKFETATADLISITASFKNGVASWDNYVDAKALVPGELTYASETKKSTLDAAVSATVNTAAEAATQAETITTANRLYFESNALAEGVIGAVNKTELITNPDANDGGNGWSGSFGTLSSEALTQGDGTSGGSYFDKNGASSYEAAQTIENLPAGQYIVSVTARAQTGVSNYKLNVTNSADAKVSTNISAIGNKGGVFGRGFNDYSLVFEQPTNGDATISITAEDASNFWLSFDRFRLVRIRLDATMATSDDYAALNAAIEDKPIGFDKDEYAPYNNIEAMAVLNAAKAIDQTAENLQEDVQAATTALKNATWTVNTEELNAVYDGTFAAAEHNGAPKGWRMSNNTLGGDLHSRAFVGDDRMKEFNETNSGLFLRFDGNYSNRGSMYYYGDTENYSMPLKADVTYYAKVDVAGWGSTGKPIRMNVTGPEGFSAQGQQVNTNVRADNADNAPQQLLIVFTATVAGNYVINFQTPGSDDNKHNVVISNVEVKRATAAMMKITDAKYATFVAPFDVTIPDDVEVYTVDGVSGSALTLSPVSTTIPANTPVVLFKESALAETTFYGKTVDGTPTKGLLVGTYTETTAPNNGSSFVLQDGAKGIGFYKVVTDDIKVPANRAYLNYSEGDDVKAFFFGGGEDAIKSVFDGVAAGEIYDLSGRKVAKMQKGGAYIVNGKKVIVK